MYIDNQTWRTETLRIRSTRNDKEEQNKEKESGSEERQRIDVHLDGEVEFCLIATS